MPERTLPPINQIHTIVFDFDGVFTDNKVWVDQDGRECVRCDRSDGLAFDLLRAFQRRTQWLVELFILSKEPNPVVLTRAKKLKINCYYGVSDKLKYISQYLSERFPDKNNMFSGLVYLGNDLNDLPVMRHAGFSIAPSDAHSLVREVASCVFPQRGGDGFVRAFIEELLGINKLTKEKIDELVSDR